MGRSSPLGGCGDFALLQPKGFCLLLARITRGRAPNSLFAGNTKNNVYLTVQTKVDKGMHKPSNVASWKGSPFAVAVMFLGNGFVLASSYFGMPAIRDQLDSTPTQLAFALACMGIGSVLGMPLTGRFSQAVRQ
jgi:hypothetical protein